MKLAKRMTGIALGLMVAGSGTLLLGDPAVKLETDVQKASYGLGQKIGKNWKQQGLDIDAAVFSASLKEALEGHPSKLSDSDIEAALGKLQAGMEKKMEEMAKKNKTDGEKFLADNKKKTGVTTTTSGLQYKVVTEGKGDAPKAEQKVKVHYVGKLIDGTEFDSSRKRGEPATFPVNGVIPGWTEALKLMKPGAKWELAIPSDLAYGARGTPGIPPNSVLTFEVELLEVMKEAPAPAKPAAEAAMPSAKKGATK